MAETSLSTSSHAKLYTNVYYRVERRGRRRSPYRTSDPYMKWVGRIWIKSGHCLLCEVSNTIWLPSSSVLYPARTRVRPWTTLKSTLTTLHSLSIPFNDFPLLPFLSHSMELWVNGYIQGCEYFIRHYATLLMYSPPPLLHKIIVKRGKRRRWYPISNRIDLHSKNVNQTWFW